MPDQPPVVYDLTDNHAVVLSSSSSPRRMVTRLALADQRMDFDDEFEDDGDAVEPEILIDPLSLLLQQRQAPSSLLSTVAQRLPNNNNSSKAIKMGSKKANQERKVATVAANDDDVTVVGGASTMSINTRKADDRRPAPAVAGLKPPPKNVFKKCDGGGNVQSTTDDSGYCTANRKTIDLTLEEQKSFEHEETNEDPTVTRQQQRGPVLEYDSNYNVVSRKPPFAGPTSQNKPSQKKNKRHRKNNNKGTYQNGNYRFDKSATTGTGQSLVRSNEREFPPVLDDALHDNNNRNKNATDNAPTQHQQQHRQPNNYYSNPGGRGGCDSPWDIRRMELDRFAQVQAIRQQELERRTVALEHRERALRQEKQNMMTVTAGGSLDSRQPTTAAASKENDKDEETNIRDDDDMDEHERDLLSRGLARERVKLHQAVTDHEENVGKDRKEFENKMKEQSRELLREKAQLQQAIADHELRVEKDKNEFNQLKLQSLELTKQNEQLQKAMADQTQELVTNREENAHLKRQVNALTNDKATLQETIAEYDERIKRTEQRARHENEKLEQQRHRFYEETRLFRRDRDAFRTFADEERSRFRLVQSQFEAEKLEHIRTVNEKISELSKRDKELVQRGKDLEDREKTQQDYVAAFERRCLETESDFVRRDETLLLTQAFLDREVEDMARARESATRLQQRLSNQQQQNENVAQAAEAKHAKQRKDLEEWISKAESTLRQKEESLSKREELLENKDAELNRREMAHKRRSSELNHTVNRKKVKLGETSSTESEPEQPEASTPSVTACSKSTTLQVDHPSHGRKAPPEPSPEVSNEVPVDQGFVLVDSDDDSVCHVEKPKYVRPKKEGFDSTNRFNSYLDNDTATEMQEKMFQEAAAKFRNRHHGNIKASVASASVGPPTITDPIHDISTRYPNHWKWSDPYARLGLPINASNRLIKKQYRALARLYHPDKSHLADTSDRFNAVSAAYHHLLHTG